jgi:hypothetical protein
MLGVGEVAERVAQTTEELGFPRLFRKLKDSGQASLLRLLTAMQHPPSPEQRAKPRPKPTGLDPLRPTMGGNVAKSWLKAVGAAPSRF